MNKTIASIAAASVVALALSACTPEVPLISPTPSVEANAALIDEQADAVIADTFAQLAIADASRNEDDFGNRIGGDALDVRAAQYAVADTEDGPTPVVLPETMQAIYVSAADGWPRVLVAVTEPPPSDLTPVVMMWIQDDVRSPYQLRGWAHMIPGASMPLMPGTNVGATQLSLGEDSVEPSPRQALDDYLELLREGPTSDLNEVFGPDLYRDRLFAKREALGDAAEDADGEYIDTIQPRIADTFSMSTSDGGALVFAPVEIASSFSVEDATVSVPRADRALVDGDLDDKLTYYYLDFIVLYVPGPASGSRPVLVAAEHNLVRVSDN